MLPCQRQQRPDLLYDTSGSYDSFVQFVSTFDANELTAPDFAPFSPMLTQALIQRLLKTKK